MILVSIPPRCGRIQAAGSFCAGIRDGALQAFKRLNRFVRFLIGVMKLEIPDLTEYQDLTIPVLMYRDRPGGAFTARLTPTSPPD
jgi:hypothetical protein